MVRSNDPAAIRLHQVIAARVAELGPERGDNGSDTPERPHDPKHGVWPIAFRP